MKEHKTFNQQLTILRGRGMVVPTKGKMLTIGQSFQKNIL
ncbi:hypothetical protein SMU82_08710 [Streptococcus mutans SM6]|uniref:Uncharacterized protein n=1 Tax=Streptococcus mutans SM6 TaxID=857119 RepID=A0A829BTH5_STRMG|nr:hypothetical protein SMU62_04390 [Streptococcus mutans M21]EMC22432.1 hypothetical protein SMU82_08710 [Streptococcus mutans SM6]